MKKIRVDKAEWEEVLAVVKTVRAEQAKIKAIHTKKCNNRILHSFAKTLSEKTILKGELCGCVWNEEPATRTGYCTHSWVPSNSYRTFKDIVNIEGIEFLYTHTRPVDGKMLCTLSNGMININGQLLDQLNNTVSFTTHNIFIKPEGFLHYGYINNKYTERRCPLLSANYE